jgi:hypothetical protein
MFVYESVAVSLDREIDVKCVFRSPAKPKMVRVSGMLIFGIKKPEQGIYRAEGLVIKQHNSELQSMMWTLLNNVWLVQFILKLFPSIKLPL